MWLPPQRRMCSSEWHRPDVLWGIRTSYSLGGSRSSSVISQSVPGLCSTAARVVMLAIGSLSFSCDLGNHLGADQVQVVEVVDIEDVQVGDLRAGRLQLL